jgi:hypothetical protein
MATPKGKPQFVLDQLITTMAQLIRTLPSHREVEPWEASIEIK